jgi:hypothetical protein
LLPFFERYNWGRECLIFPYMTSQLNIQSPPILEDFQFATFFTKHISFTWQPQKSL